MDEQLAQLKAERDVELQKAKLELAAMARSASSADDDNIFIPGSMVQVSGLISKPELNGRHALVVDELSSNGRIPVVIAPLMPDEALVSILVKPQNIELAPQPPEVMATAWNNVAFAYKRANRLAEAGQAYEYALVLALPEDRPLTISNLVKLCAAAQRSGQGDPEAINRRMSQLMQQLFEPMTSLPELRGLDCTYGIDFVPGYEQRMLLVGIVHSVDAQPARSKYARLWVFAGGDSGRGRIVEVSPATGEELKMSAEALEALRNPGRAVRCAPDAVADLPPVHKWHKNAARSAGQ